MPTPIPRALYRLAGTAPPADPRPALEALEQALARTPLGQECRGGRIRPILEPFLLRRPA